MDLSKFDELYGSNGKNFVVPVSRVMKQRKLLDSGLFTFNLVHGTGGVYTGCAIRLMGPPGVGKSSLCYRIMASGLAQGMSALVIDSEASFNANIFADTMDAYGLDGDKVLADDTAYRVRVVPPTNLREVTKGKRPFFTIEEMIPMVENWVVSKDISPEGAIVIVDSLDFIASDDQIEKGVESQGVALVARRLKNWMRRFVGTIRGTGSLMIFVSQVSSKIDPHAHDTETFFGGNAIKHFSSLDIRFKDIGQAKDGDDLVGRKVQATIGKSKQGKPWRRFEYVIRNDVGPDNYAAVIDAAITYGVIKKAGTSSWYDVPLVDGELHKFQGYKSVREMLIEHPKNFELIYKAVLDHARGEDRISEEVSPEDDDETGSFFTEDSENPNALGDV